MPANTYGRQVTEALTNKSGGAVIAGDVVVIDTTNNDAFTTSTAGGVISMIGVAQEGIANNATGRVLTAGYAALVNVNASVTRGNFGKTHTVAKQATDAGASRAAGAFCQFLTGGTTPDAHLFGMPDASTSASGVPAGTSFPGSPATNDLYYRTDRALLYYYDGTRWLTTTEYGVALQLLDAVQPFGSSPGNDLWGATDLGANGQWVTRLSSMVLVTPTNTGAAYWTFQLASLTAAAVSHNIGSTFDTSADTAGQRVKHTVTIGAAVTAGDTHFIHVQTKTGSPSNAYIETIVFYRLIG